MRIEKDLIITASVLVALGAVFAFAVLMPSRNQSAKLDRNIIAAEAELGLTPNAQTELKDLETKVVALREKVNRAQGRVPEDDDMAEVIHGINESLREHGVTEQEMVTRRTQRHAHYNIIPVTLEFQSSFPVVFGALQRIEEMPRLIRVDQLEVAADAEDPAAPLRVYMQLCTFSSRHGGS